MINETQKAQQLKEITQKMIKIQVMGSIGSILVGLALYGIFGAQGDAFHPLLNNMDVVYSMLVTGGVIMLWEVIVFISLVKKRNTLMKDN